jgi:hypothetical protein
MDTGRTTPPFINSWGEWSVGFIDGNSTPSDTNGQAWRANFRILYIPFRLDWPYRVAKVFWCNGNATGGNVDMGIMDRFGTRLYHTGSTVQAGTSAPQTVTGGLALPAGRYYWAIQLSSTSGKLELIQHFTNDPISTRVTGVLRETTDPVAIGIPTTASFATVTNGEYPLVGMTDDTTLTF